jgi:hypothetical protein
MVKRRCIGEGQSCASVVHKFNIWVQDWPVKSEFVGCHLGHVEPVLGQNQTLNPTTLVPIQING